MEKDRIILKFIKKVRKHICKNIRIKTLLWAMVSGILLWGVVNTVALFVPFYYAPVYGIAVFLISLLAGFIVAKFRYPDLRSAALSVDSKGLDERVTTAYELSGKEDVYSLMQKEDTLQHISKVEIRKIFPLNVKKRVFVAMFAALVFGITTAMIPAQSKELARAQHDLKRQIEEKAEEIEDITEEFAKKYELTQEQIEALEDLLNETRRELSNVTQQEQLSKVQERFENKLSTQFEYPLESYLEAKALENALDTAKDGGISPEEKEELLDKLNQMRQEAKDKEFDELMEQIEKELKENGEISQQSRDRLRKFIDEKQGEIGQRDNRSGGMQEPGVMQPGEKGNTNQPDGQQGSDNKNGQGGSSGDPQSSKYAKEEVGNRNGERVMIGDDMPFNETLTGQANADGESELIRSDQVIEWEGNSVEYDKVIGEYTNRAYDSLEKSNLPDSMKKIIKDYFVELNE